VHVLKSPLCVKKKLRATLGDQCKKKPIYILNSADIYVLGIDICCQVEFVVQSYQNYILFPLRVKVLQ